MVYIILPFLFIIGLAFGSFLNAFEYRLFTNQDWVKSRSHCPNCKHELDVFDLIPLLSWVLLSGKCRYCKKEISIQYPIVELGMGVLFAGYGWIVLRNSFQNGLSTVPTAFDFGTLIFGLIVIWALVFFTVYDLKYGLIPDKVLFPLIGITIARNVVLFFMQNQNGLSIVPTNFNFLNHILAAIIAGGFFFLVIFFTKGRGMGGGDMKFAFWLGLFFGGIPTLLVLYISFIVGGIYGAVVLLTRKKKFGQTLPFGPFLCLGAMVVLFFQDFLINLVSEVFFGGLL